MNRKTQKLIREFTTFKSIKYFILEKIKHTNAMGSKPKIHFYSIINAQFNHRR